MASHERLQPEQAFIARFGVEPNPVNLDHAAFYLCVAMCELGMACQHRLERQPDSAFSHLQTAALYLYVDGNVCGFPINTKGEIPEMKKAREIAGEFIDGKDDGIKAEFEEVLGILSEVSGEDLTWLKPHFGISTEQLKDKERAGEIELTPEQLTFLRNGGFFTREERGLPLMPV